MEVLSPNEFYRLPLLWVLKKTNQNWEQTLCLYMAEQSSPEHAHVRIPETYGYVAFYGKRDFADEIKVIIFRWGDYPGVFEWVPNIITSVTHKLRVLETSVNQ